MKKYEILEHKADLKIKVYGKTKEELFSNMLFAMAKSQNVTTLPEKVTREINVNSPDLPSLLVDFLSEALYLTQVNKEVYTEVKFKKFTDPSTSSGQAELEAELTGKKVERFGEDIKAVTYHSLDIHQKEDGTWQATVLFDV